jgi:signal transduction histidine kinase
MMRPAPSQAEEGPPGEGPPGPAAQARIPAWKAALPLGFVAAGLIALALVPALMNRAIGTHVERIENVTQPARALVTGLETHLAHEVSLTRGYLLTGDIAFIDRYVEVHERHRALYEELHPLAREMGPEVLEPFHALERLVQQREEATAAFLRGGIGEAEFTARLPGRQVVFEETLSTLQELEWAMLRVEERHRERIGTLRSWDLWLSMALVALALLASVVVLLIGRRYLRLLAGAERHHRELAQVMATRSRLIRGIGHDVKNPLGAADGYAELLEEGLQGELTPGQTEYVGRIRRMHRSAIDIIDNLQELARAESGQLRVRLIETEVGQVVRDTAEDYRAAAERGGLGLEVSVPEGLPAVRTDPVRVRAILGNLLSNAIKYTPRGGEIRVKTEVRQHADGPAPGPWIVVQVEDNGPGIPSEACERIFGEYERLDPGAAEGAGIGLAISRTVARALGGDITVRSTVGEGSTFTLWLPERNGSEGSDG